MNERYIIGIDIGTTGTKAILFGEDGTPVAHAYRGYTLSTPAVGRSEHNAEGYVSAVAEIGIASCRFKYSLKLIKCFFFKLHAVLFSDQISNFAKLLTCIIGKRNVKSNS